MFLRVARPDDASAILALAVAFYAEDGFTTPAAELDSNLRALLVSDLAHIAIVEVDGKAAAFAITTLGFGLEDGAIAELEDMFVVPGARRRGIAAALIDDSAVWARSRGCRRLEVVVAPNGHDVDHLHRWYASRGFADNGRRLRSLPL